MTPPAIACYDSGGEEVQHDLEDMRGWFEYVVDNKDQLTPYGVQKVVDATCSKTQVIGRKGIGVEHLHSTINRLIDENLGGCARPRVSAEH